MTETPYTIEINQLPRPENFNPSDPEKPELKIKRIQAVQKMIRETGKKNGIEIKESDQLESPNSTHYREGAIAEAARLKRAIPDLSIPTTLPYEIFQIMPFFPVVAKNTGVGHGKSKYLIETQEQWDKFQGWVESSGEQKQVNEEWVFQEYIPPVTDRPISYRVIVDCSGNIITSQIIYGPEDTKNVRVLLSDRLPHEKNVTESSLEDPQNEHFLNARSIASNRAFVLKMVRIPQSRYDSKDGYIEKLAHTDPKTGERFWTSSSGSRDVQSHEKMGGRIPLNPKNKQRPISTTTENILGALGLDKKTPGLPASIKLQASSIARLVGKQEKTVKALWLGIDFIPGKDGKNYFLECNWRPSLTAVADHLGKELNEKTTVEILQWLINQTIEHLVTE